MGGKGTCKVKRRTIRTGVGELGTGKARGVILKTTRGEAGRRAAVRGGGRDGNRWWEEEREREHHRHHSRCP